MPHAVLNRRTRRGAAVGVALAAALVAVAVMPAPPPAGGTLEDNAARWVRRLPGARIHWSSPAIADLDADGSDDVVVGDPTYTNGETTEGRITLYYGR